MGLGGNVDDEALAAPLAGGDAPLERSWGQNVRINPYNFVLRQLRAAASRETAGEAVRLRGLPQR